MVVGVDKSIVPPPVPITRFRFGGMNGSEVSLRVLRKVPPELSVIGALAKSLSRVRLATLSTPPFTLTAPVKVLAPLNVNVPAPVLTKPPLPLITPLRVRFAVLLSICSVPAPARRHGQRLAAGRRAPVYFSVPPIVTGLPSPNGPAVWTHC